MERRERRESRERRERRESMERRQMKKGGEGRGLSPLHNTERDV